MLRASIRPSGIEMDEKDFIEEVIEFASIRPSGIEIGSAGGEYHAAGQPQ